MVTVHTNTPQKHSMSYSIEHDPKRLIDVWTTPDGRRVTLRPVPPQDAALEQALVRTLSPRSRYQRFFTPIRELPESWLSRMTQIDDLQHLALIVEVFTDGLAVAVAVAVAEARYVADDSGRECEFGVIVADAWQRQGLARRLLSTLMRSATEAGAGVVQVACDLPPLRPEFGLGHEWLRPTRAG